VKSGGFLSTQIGYTTDPSLW